MQLTYEEAGRLGTLSAGEEELSFDDVVTIPAFGVVTGSAISLTLWVALGWAVWAVWTVV